MFVLVPSLFRQVLYVDTILLAAIISSGSLVLFITYSSITFVRAEKTPSGKTEIPLEEISLVK